MRLKETCGDHVAVSAWTGTPGAEFHLQIGENLLSMLQPNNDAVLFTFFFPSLLCFCFPKVDLALSYRKQPVLSDYCDGAVPELQSAVFRLEIADCSCNL